MNKSNETIPGYRAWRDDPENSKEIQDYTEALWQVLENPELLNSDQVLLNRVYALLKMCLGLKRLQYSLVCDLALKDGYSYEDLELCLLGKLIQKMISAKAKLLEKKKKLDCESFNRYLFVVTRIVTGNCLTELAEELLGSECEDQQNWYDIKGTTLEISLERAQYNINLRNQARLLAKLISENWKERELNVLCHDLDAGSDEGTQRLVKENRDNIYQLHKRIRDKLRKLMVDHQIDEDAGRLFIGKFLKRLCQNCPVFTAYKDKGESNSKGEIQ